VTDLDGNGVKYLEYLVTRLGPDEDLIKDLLDYSRIGREKEAMSVDSRQTLAEVLADLDKSIRESGAHIHSNGLPVLRAYPTELKAAATKPDHQRH
jgi:light-regulated signal transduction histidine kinase (bacteriophytochrome)